MIQPTEHLLGREGELAALGRSLDQLSQGRPGAIVIAGEPGIGKTRLLRELASMAETRDQLVLSGAASEMEHDLPFAPFIDAMDKYLAGLERHVVGGLAQRDRDELAHIFPSLHRLAGGGDVALQLERHRSHRAVRGLLERLAMRTPLLLALDDLHWADPASVELLGALLRRLPDAPVLIACAVRPRQSSALLRAVLERAEREGSLTRMELSALTEQQARTLLGPRLDQATVTALYEESGGNPFYLHQLSRGVDRANQGGPAAAALSQAIGVPSTIAAALTEELAHLSAPARLVLEGAAVAGDPFEPDLAAAAASVTEAAAIEAIDELLALDVIRQTEAPRRFRFRHPLVRRAVYETAPAGWRLGAHERTAEALAARGATASTRATHIERSAHQGDLDAIAVLSEAGEAAARLAPASAARWFSAALRLMPQSAPASARIEFLVARAGCLAATGQLTESRADLLAALDLGAVDARDWHVRVATACASVEHLLGMHGDARRHLLAALTDLEDDTSAQAVGLMIELTVDGFYGGDFDAMLDWSERAVRTASALDDRPVMAAALAARAYATAIGGAGFVAQGICDDAAKAADSLTDHDLTPRLSTLAQLATAEFYLDRFPATVRHAQRGMDIGRETGQGDQFPLLTAVYGGALWVMGRPHEAIDVFDGAVEAARLAANVQSMAWSLFNRAIAALAAGNLDGALADSRESERLSDEMESGPLAALAASVFATAAFEAGDAQAAIDVMPTKAGGEDLPLVGGAWRARFLEVLTRALLAVGRSAEAQRAAVAARACADVVALPTAAAMADLAAADLLLSSGEPSKAAEVALVAASELDAAAAAWDAARARVLAGMALEQAGERQGAAAQLQRAAAAFESFGSLRYRDQAERELRRLGQRIHRRSRPGKAGAMGLESLTERELELARMVVDRKTNAQIAAELFLSQKTVETHLRNIFNKVGVSSRVDLARAVERASD